MSNQAKTATGIVLVIAGIGITMLFQNCGGGVGDPSVQQKITEMNTTQMASTSLAESSSGSTIAPMTQFVDSGKNIWTLVKGVAYRNGSAKEAGPTADITTLLYYEANIYQLNNKGDWYKFNGSTTAPAWPAVSGDPRVATAASANNTDIDSTGKIVDSSKNVWTIVGGHVMKNGTAAGTTSGVINLIYSGGLIYQENSYHNFFKWDSTNSTWPGCNPPIPPKQASMYPTLAFETDFAGQSTSTLESSKLIDMSNSKKDGYKWYTSCPWCGNSSSSAFTVVDTGNVQALHIDGSSASYLYSKNGAAGLEFPSDGSRGAYFEIRMAMAKADTGAGQFPAFWALQTLGTANTYWSPHANKNYDENVELDFMEFNQASPARMGSTLHSWYGTRGCSGEMMTTSTKVNTTELTSTGTVAQSGATVTGTKTAFTSAMVGGTIFFNNGTAATISAVNSTTKLTVSPSQTVAAGTGFSISAAKTHYCDVNSQTITDVHLSDSAGVVTLESASASAPVYNTLGILWIPSVKQSNGTYSQGSMKFYWNDVPFGSGPITWTGPLPTNAFVPAKGLNWTYAGIDRLPYGLILEAGGGNGSKTVGWMNVQWVHVWQK